MSGKRRARDSFYLLNPFVHVNFVESICLLDLVGFSISVSSV